MTTNTEMKKHPVADMLDTKQAAAYLGITFKSLEAWMREGRAPRYYKVGPRNRFDPVDLDNFIRVIEPTNLKGE